MRNSKFSEAKIAAILKEAEGGVAVADPTLAELVKASEQTIQGAEQAQEATREQELRQAEALAGEQRRRIALV